MSESVSLRLCGTGEVREHFPVDAKEILDRGGTEWIRFQPIPPRQISGHHSLKRKSDRALIIGTGPTMESEVADVGLSGFDIFCVNDAVWTYKCAHFVTWHSEKLEVWKRNCKFWPFPLVHSREPQPGVNVAWDWSTLRGSSALCAVMVALAMEYPTIVVVGVPLTERYETYRDSWLQHRWCLNGKLHSAGGWLAENFSRWGEA